MTRLDFWKSYREEQTNEKYLNLNIRREISLTNGKCILYIWKGNQSKPYAKYSFSSTDSMEAYIEREKAKAKSIIERKEAEAKEKKELTKDYKVKINVGDIYVSSWGYDQTNIDYYEVVSVKNKTVVLQEIGKFTEDEDSFMSNLCKPNRAVKKGEPFKKIVQLHVYRGEVVERINLNSYSSCSPWDGRMNRESFYA